MTLTKFHLIDAIAEQNGFTRKKSSETVETLLEIIKSALASVDDVLISGFGKFCVKDKRERKGRNPATGEDMMLAPKRVVTFKCSGKLRERVNREGYRIEQLPGNKKNSKLKKEKNTMTIKQDLRSLNKDIQALGKTINKLIAAVEKGEKPTTGKKTTAKPIKAKTTKKSPTPAQKDPAKKNIAQPTATDQVLEIINGSKNGVNIKTLMEKTRFNQKKVTNILQRTYKQGKIKRVGKGVYVGA